MPRKQFTQIGGFKRKYPVNFPGVAQERSHGITRKQCDFMLRKLTLERVKNRTGKQHIAQSPGMNNEHPRRLLSC